MSSEEAKWLARIRAAVKRAGLVEATTLSPARAARALGISLRSMDAMVRRGRVRTSTVGGHRVITTAELRRLGRQVRDPQDARGR